GLDGQPLVNRYSLAIYQSGGATPLQIVDLGKPALGTDGTIQVSLTDLLRSPLPPNMVYQARVAALGPGGNATSDWSNPFEISTACTYSVSVDVQSFGASGGSGAVTVTAPPGCGWTAASDDPSWVATTSSGGIGGGSVGFTVAANAAASGRS